MGFRRFVVDPDITKDFYQLRSICSVYADSIEIIVNNMCMHQCPYKMFHYNYEAHTVSTNKQKENRYFYEKCTAQKADKFDNYIKINWIRPEDLHYYQNLGIRYYKIQGRNHPAGKNVLAAVQAYANGQYSGNLIDLLTLWNPYNIFQPVINNPSLNGYLEPFVYNDHFCKDKCNECEHCMSYAKKSIDLVAYSQLSEYAKKLYS